MKTPEEVLDEMSAKNTREDVEYNADGELHKITLSTIDTDKTKLISGYRELLSEDFGDGLIPLIEEAIFNGEIDVVNDAGLLTAKKIADIVDKYVDSFITKALSE